MCCLQVIYFLDEILFSIPKLDSIRDADDPLSQTRCVKFLAFGDVFKMRNGIIFSK